MLSLIDVGFTTFDPENLISVSKSEEEVITEPATRHWYGLIKEPAKTKKIYKCTIFLEEKDGSRRIWYTRDNAEERNKIYDNIIKALRGCGISVSKIKIV